MSPSLRTLGRWTPREVLQAKNLKVGETVVGKDLDFPNSTSFCKKLNPGGKRENLLDTTQPETSSERKLVNTPLVNFDDNYVIPDFMEGITGIEMRQMFKENPTCLMGCFDP